MDQLDALRLAGEAPKGPTIVEFYTEAVENTFKTQQEGRPQFDEIEFARFRIPGDKNSSPVSRVTDEIKAQFPKEYEAFKAGLEPPLDGTPLSEWPPISKALLHEFAYFNIKTIEQLAGINDAHLQNLPMGSRALREQAKAYLAIAREGTAPIAQMLGKIDRLEGEVARKDQVIADMGARLDALEKRAAP